MSADGESQGAGAKPGERVHDDQTVAQGLILHSGADGNSAASSDVADRAEFSRSLVDLGIIESEELESLAAPISEGVLGLSRALVQSGKLTPYQAAAVYQKKSRGLLIGNYIILDKIGQGGMGMVFKCRHRRLGRAGALKILPPSFARDRQALMRFRREVEAAGRLKHPNVVAAVDADEDRGVHFLVMEYVEGRDLDRVVRDLGPMAISQAIDCIIQAARGLEAAHSQGIIHRDIKPANLMLDATGTVRVLDLGFVRIIDAANPFGKVPGGRLTESGTYMGTVDFMAPEQAEDSRRADHRADIYALGCSLYYLLTGQAPFDGPTVLKRLMAHLEQPAPSLRSKRPEAPTKLEAIFQKMMAKRPENRPESMTELIALLEACKADAFAKTSSAGAPTSRPELMTFNEQALKRPALPKTQHDPSILSRATEREGLAIPNDFNLEDLIIDVRSDPKPEPLLRPANAAAGRSQPLDRAGHRTYARRMPRSGGFIAAVGSLGVLAALFTWFIFFRDHRGSDSRLAVKTSAGTDQSAPAKKQQLAATPGGQSVTAPTFQDEVHTIFDGTSNNGWMLCNKRPLPRSHVQKDGLNPRGTGSYLVVYQEKLSDFELEFDYKLDMGCRSGVCLRVSELADPVATGIEVALDDSTGRGLVDSGAFFGLVAPRVNAQKPAREWNHMKITAQGPEIAVVLNGTPVSSINLDEWTTPGKRPDGSEHEFKSVAVASLARIGYVGFKGLTRDCWFNQVRLKKLSPAGVSRPKAIARSTVPAPTARLDFHGDGTLSGEAGGGRPVLARARELADQGAQAWQFRLELDALFDEAKRMLEVPLPR